MSQFLRLESRLLKRGFFCVAGIDEAGRGPLAGPVVSAAVILKSGARLPGLTDSKKLSEKKREELFPKIIANCLDYAISIVPNQIIDQINILEATRVANLHCIEALNLKADIAVIDGKDKQYLEIPFISVIKGDLRVKSIAAASILAKVTRDRLMKKYAKLHPEYQFDQHMGYGTRQHRNALQQHGPCPIHRLSFSYKSSE